MDVCLMLLWEQSEAWHFWDCSHQGRNTLGTSNVLGYSWDPSALGFNAAGPQSLYTVPGDVPQCLPVPWGCSCSPFVLPQILHLLPTSPTEPFLYSPVVPGIWLAS